MELRLIIMRHAKSSWSSGASSDHDRPLNKRGKRDAPRVAEHLAQIGWVPDRVCSSTSQRTRETWERMTDAFDDDTEVEFSSRLYHGGVGALLDELISCPSDVDTLLVLGHNPGWEHAVEWLSGDAERMTTANAALLSGEFDSWEESANEPRRWTLVTVIRPKEL